MRNFASARQLSYWFSRIPNFQGIIVTAADNPPAIEAERDADYAARVSFKRVYQLTIAPTVTVTVGLLAMAGLLCENLPTTFRRAVAITFFYILIVLVIAGIVVALGDIEIR